MSAEHDGGTVAVVTALAANVGIALSKFVGFAVTGSSSMASEAVHSVVDCGNQILLLIGAKATVRAPDERHQFGYGPEKFFLSVAVVLEGFSLRTLIKESNKVRGGGRTSVARIAGVVDEAERRVRSIVPSAVRRAVG